MLLDPRHLRGCLASGAMLALLLLAPCSAHCQPPTLPTPRLLILSPAGGKAGSSVELTCTGTDLEEPEQLLFSDPGIQAVPIEEPKPAPSSDPKKKPPQPKPKPGMGQPVVTRFKVTIAPTVPPGLHDVRLINHWGVSNPRALCVGDLPEVLEKEPNNDVNQAQHVELGSTINGAMANGTDVDYYQFAGKKGQRVVISCLATSIDSRFHPGLEVYDSSGKELAFSRDYNQRDALTDCFLPEDGDYLVRLYQFTHTQGSPEYFYRLSISTTPWIDAVFPCVVEAGKENTLTVYGRNLPGGKLEPTLLLDNHPLEKATVTVTPPPEVTAQKLLLFTGHVPPPQAGQDGFELRLRNDAGSSNPFPLTVTGAQVVLDNGNNNTPETAQEVPVPCEIAGQVEKKRDRDWYTFSAKKGEVYTIEVLGSRIGSPCFLYFLLRSEKADIKESDENNDMLNRKFVYRSEDPLPFRFTAPADGKYQLLVASRLADTLAGPRDYYRVRITPDQPDFRLIAMSSGDDRPDAPLLYQDGNQAFTVFALRRDGFDGDIELSMEGLPPGVRCPTQVLAGAVREATLVLHADPTAPSWTGPIKIRGSATIRGEKVVREARPADIVWPVQPNQNIPTLTRLAHSLYLAVRPGAPYRVALKLEKPVLVQGEKSNLLVEVTRFATDFKSPLTVQALATELPPGLAINNNQPFNIDGKKDAKKDVKKDEKKEARKDDEKKEDGRLPISVNDNVPPGLYTIVLRTKCQIAYSKDPMAKQKPNVEVMEPSSPVVLTILPRALATLVFSNGSPTIKAGQQVEVVVRVTRLHNYNGDLQLTVKMPGKDMGLEAPDVVIPAGKNEAKLVFRADAGARPGNRPNLIVRAIGTFLGKPTTQEAKLNVNVVK